MSYIEFKAHLNFRNDKHAISNHNHLQVWDKGEVMGCFLIFQYLCHGTLQISLNHPKTMLFRVDNYCMSDLIKVVVGGSIKLIYTS